MNIVSRSSVITAGRRRIIFGAYLFSVSLAMTLGLVASARAEKRGYDVGAVPKWVEPVAPDLAAVVPSQQIANGVYYLLTDTQVRVDGAERVSYRHTAVKALDAQGVQSIANIDVRFDPSYQRLTLHAINVRRGAQKIEKTGTVKVKLLQRETDLEALIYDGSITASVFLEDVRPGDVVEYAYSIRGQNPVFSGKQFGRFEMQWSVPVARASARLLWPLGRDVQLLRANGAASPTIKDGATHRDYRWDGRDLAARRVDNDAPSWFDPFPSVQWGEFEGWQDVARWAVPLYRLPERGMPNVQAEIARIGAAHATPERRLLAALRFVQGEVRYLGVEVGAGSHSPSAPELVLMRRFGDCKDKTLLTIALLRGLGIEARPALVNTVQRRGIQTWQPSPGAFNHVIVRAEVSGAVMWIDPTRAPQQGEIEQLAQADYGLALVVDGQSDRLVPMAGEKALIQQRSIRSVIDSRAGVDKPAVFTVTTVSAGPGAESMRSTLKAQGRENLQRQYLNYYARFYPGAELAAPFEVMDDTAANRVTITEHYTLNSFWQRSERNKRTESSIEAPELLEMLRSPSRRVRDSPLSLSHPVDVTNVTEVLLPDRWNGADRRLRVEDAAFDFERVEHWDSKKVTLTDRFISRVDHVEAADIARYASNLDKARQGLNYTLFTGRDDLPAPKDRESNPLHWVAAVAGTLTLVGMGTVALRVYRWDPAPPTSNEWTDYAAPSGLGGWLILVALGICISLYKFASTLWESWPSYRTDVWFALTTPGAPAYHPMWGMTLVFELVFNLALIAGYLLMAALFLSKRSSFPRVFIAVTATAFAVALIDTALAASIPAAKQASEKQGAELLRALIFTALWIAYFRQSVRARKTFVQRLRPAQSPAPGTSVALPA